MTVGEALQFRLLRGAKVLTPVQGNKPITWVSVIEVPVEEFIRPGEFVMSTGMNMGKDPALLSGFVREVAQASPSALAIATGPHTPAIPRQAVREAVRNRLLFIELPWKVRFSEISEVILKHLMREHISSRSLDEFVWSLATNSITEEDAAAQGRQFGYDPQARYVAILGRVKGRGSASPGEDSSTEPRLVRELCDKLAVQTRTRWLGTAAGDSVLGFLEVEQAKNRTRAWLARINAQLKLTCYVSWGIGRVCTGFSDLLTSYQDAVAACDIGQATNGSGSITDVSDVLGDRVLMKLKQDADVAMLEKRYIQPLRRARRMQLVETLEKYFENDCNASETARLLNISRQALLYRLNKSEEILNCDFGSSQQRFAIALSLRLHKLSHR